MDLIALEEHFALPSLRGRIDKSIIAKRGWPDMTGGSAILERANQLLPDLGEQRLRSMDENGIRMQVLSLAGPGADLLPEKEALAFARDANDGLAEKIAAHPDRFAGFAHLPMSAPYAAAEELDRAVSSLGFCGALINGITDNLFLDDPQFAPILAKAASLAVPLYLHPSFPPVPIQELYYDRLPPSVSSALASAAFGWHAEVAIHILRLIVSGTLDRYPKLRLIIGHMGEMLPFMMYRAEGVLPTALTKAQRSVSETLRSQVFITTSGLFTVPPLITALDTFGIDNILFSVDYPYSSNEQGKAFVDSLPLTPAAIAQIAHGNAEKLLKLPVATAMK
jgi:uncharacterized protein